MQRSMRCLVTVLLLVALQRTTAELQDENVFKFDRDDDVQSNAQGFAFASYYASDMVLQQAPASAGLWGYAPLDQIGHIVTVRVVVGSTVLDKVSTPVRRGPFGDRAVWNVVLHPRPNTAIVDIRASLGGFPTIKMKDVLFGDVWICSGQSNMQFSVGQMFGARREIDAAVAFKNIRLFNVDRVMSTTPVYDIPKIIFSWMSPAKGAWDGFSAVCWLYGKMLHEELGYPVGLIDTTWGGTPVEAWSSPEALAECGLHGLQKLPPVPGPGNLTGYELDLFEYYDAIAHPYGSNIPHPRTASVLWNSMVHPFINMTIKGAIWYQGEANHEYHVDLYNCTFSSMVRDWRRKFYLGSHGNNEEIFPFGFVQIGPNAPGNITRGYPDVRWHQMGDTATGPTIPNSFMAVAIDLWDPDSPYGSVHYQDKPTVAKRLVTAALLKVFKRGTDTHLYPTREVLRRNRKELKIQFQDGAYEINVRNNLGYEVCCAASPEGCPVDGATGWLNAPIVKHNQTWITLSWATCGQKVVLGYRYEWRESPCPYLRCAVYSDWNQHPLPPMIRMFSKEELARAED